MPKKKKSSRSQNKRSWIAGALIGIWVVFTVSLIAWWYIFSQQQIERLSSAEGQIAAELVRNQKMLMWEGAALVLSLLIGGIALGYFVWRDQRRSQDLMDFFLTFTHELKTPLSTLRLQTEHLIDKTSTESDSHQISKQLQGEVDRLSLQLDNSLVLARLHGYRLFVEEVELHEVLRPILSEFNDLNISLPPACLVTADVQALGIVLRNIFKNATVHGKASQLVITATEETPSRISLLFADNGVGLQGSPSQLGKRFSRLYRGSGNGIGLFLSTKLCEMMDGTLNFPEVHYPETQHNGPETQHNEDQKGFTVEVTFPGQLLSSEQAAA